ncbi:MAG: type I-D CRISPR-associated protein Cas7/Csc2 [Caldilineaceae bacterium]|nr:type I-D CRISPR-associated protein Cas7/Csc2 [Caldilineaceae bacterium]MBP8125227.1 type I-D CRISPR-associated protein Cas7/Csc2 [Caldilineaceae bacterium]
MQTLQKYAKHLPEAYSNYPRGYYVSLILTRKVEGEAIFRTEGSGEPMNREFVHAGEVDQTVIPRVVISKRKQTAVERRIGRELLRRVELLAADAGLNEGEPEPDSIDSMVYGYAVGGGGAQKSRVITDDAFSILPATQVVGKRQFNAPFEDGTMRHPETGKASTSIGTDEYVRPETHFLDIETLKDVTPGELTYVLGNILRSSRYGAVSSRVGKVTNRLLAICFSDCELYSNLELTQTVWDHLKTMNEGDPTLPLTDGDVEKAIVQAMESLRQRVMGKVTAMEAADLVHLHEELQALYSDEEAIKAVLTTVQADYKR